MNSNREAVASSHQLQSSRNRVAVDGLMPSLPRVAEAATLGWRPQPRWGTELPTTMTLGDWF